MSDCKSVAELLVLFAENELAQQECTEVQAHLADCADCRRELAEIESVRSALSDPDLLMPSDYPWSSLPADLAKRAKAATSIRGWAPSNFGSLGWVASLAASLLIGLVLIQMVRRPEQENPTAARPAPGNESFLRRIESLSARDATTRYLIECQDLLLNLVRTEQACEGNRHDVSAEVARARELLQRKRLLDADLRAPEIARAKELCDELENLLVNLSASEVCESSDQLQQMQQFIRREQLLLRINLLRSELS